MKKKLLPQDLSDAVSRSEKISKAKAETFVRAFFETIETGLLAERFVKIKGFGTFKLVEVNERESVDVNTGERIRISGHTKVSFVPEAKMKDLVNRPFAHFESVDLNEDTSLEEFEKIDRETAELFQTPMPQEDDPTDLAEAPSAEVPTPAAIEKEEAPTPDEMDAERGGNPLDEPAEEPGEIPTEEPEAEPGESSSEEVDAEKGENPSEEPAEEPGEISSEEPQAKPEESPSEEADAERGENPSEDSSADEDAYKDDSTSNSMGYTYHEISSSRKHNWWKFTAISLIVLILMALSYFAGYFRLLCPPCLFPGVFGPSLEQPAEKVADSAKPAENPPAKPALKPSPKTFEEEKASENPSKPEKSEAAAALSPQMRYHTVEKGENLTRIVRKYYGSDDYVRMVVKHNKLKDANNIPVGFTLELPME